MGIELIRLKFFFWGLLFIPSSLHMIGFASSYALGILLLSCTILLIELMSQNPRIRFDAVSLALVLVVFVTLHLLIVVLFGSAESIALERALLSLLVLTLLIIAVGISARHALSASPKEFDRLIRVMARLLILLGFLSLIYRDIASSLLGLAKPMPPFSEPSQFSLALAPFVVYTFAVRDFRNTMAFLGLILIMTLEIQNLTFFFIIVMIVLLWLPRTVIAVLIPVFTIGGSFFYSQLQSALNTLELNYYLDRVSFEGSQNLSVLVYQQGLEIIESAFFGANKFGVGFQQLGLIDLNLNSSATISDVANAGGLNELDGGFVAAKLFGEFGLFACVLILVFFVMIVKASYEVHKHLNRAHQLSPPFLFANCCVMSYSIELTIRGMGYFSIGGTLFLFSVLLLGRKHMRSPLLKRLGGKTLPAP